MPAASQGKPILELKETRIMGGSVVFKVEYNEPLTGIVASGVYYYNYDIPLDSVPASILSIPLLGSLAPLVWLRGGEVRVGEVDSQFLTAVRSVGEQMSKWYPSSVHRTEIVATPVDTPAISSPGTSCLLYSGGVDSTASMLRHRGENLIPLMIWGSPEVRLSEGEYFRRVKAEVMPFVQSLGFNAHTVETNLIDCVNTAILRADNRGQFSEGWWVNVAHGCVLLSLCAPYAYAFKAEKLYIASSFNNIVKPWGSTPQTDEMVRWSGLKVVHDSYDMSRVDKMQRLIGPYASTNGGSIPLRVCNGKKKARLENGNLNCGECEKCTRTILQLFLAGLDPAACGFPMVNFSPSQVRVRLESGRMEPAHSRMSWRTMFQGPGDAYEQFESKYPGLSALMTWLRGWDFQPKVDFTKKVRNALVPRGGKRQKILRSIRE